MNLRKNMGYTGTLPSAGQRQRALPSAGRRQSYHMAATCATWGALGWTIWFLCLLLADNKELCIFAVCQQTAKRWPTANKTFAISHLFAVSTVPTDGKEYLCHASADGKGMTDGKFLNSSSVNHIIAFIYPM